MFGFCFYVDQYSSSSSLVCDWYTLAWLLFIDLCVRRGCVCVLHLIDWRRCNWVDVHVCVCVKKPTYTWLVPDVFVLFDSLFIYTLYIVRSETANGFFVLKNWILQSSLFETVLCNWTQNTVVVAKIDPNFRNLWWHYYCILIVEKIMERHPSSSVNGNNIIHY